jgi:hypothetical protein
MTVGQGIGDAGVMLGGVLEKWGEHAAKAKALRNVVKAYAGDDDTGKALVARADTMSLPELEGYVQGQAAQQQMKLMQARLADYAAQTEYRKQQVADEQSAGAFLQNYLNAPAPVADTAQARMGYAAANTPNMSGRVLPKVLDSLARWQQVANPDGAEVAPKETVVAGKKVIFNPRTGNFQTVDDSLDPQPVQDEDGNLYGHQVPNGKGGFKFVPVKTAPTPRPTIPAGAKPVQVNGVDYFQDEGGNLYKAPTPAGARPTAAGSLLGYLRGGTTNAAPATAKPAPVQEVTRVTKDGRKAIFDANTKQFLRYAN